MFALGFKRLIFMSFRHSGITLSLVGDLGSLLNSEIKFCSGWRKRPSNKPITVLQFEERIMRLSSSNRGSASCDYDISNTLIQQTYPK